MSKTPLEDLVFLDDNPGNFPSSSDCSPLSPTDSMGSFFLNSETENGAEEKKAAKPYSGPQVLSSEPELIEVRQIPPIARSKTYDSSLALDMKNDLKLERKKSTSNQFMKANAHFHKLFKDVPKDELLKESFTCALQKEILYQGKLYISENWICFHSKVFGKDTKIVIPTIAVTVLKKTKTAILVPNALVVATVTERFIFVSLLARDSTYKLLKSICSHLDVSASIGNSPNPSTDHIDRGEHAASFPLDFSVDFSEIDGLVRTRRKDIEEYSSTGSQTPESENSQEFQDQDKNVIKSHKPVVVESQMKSPERSKLIQQKPDDKSVFKRLNISQITSLNGLLFFYAILVCLLIISTLYMQSRIAYLEERLSTLGSVHTGWSAEQGIGSWHINANLICEELTANLEKLDKIQRSLQRLLEDAE
ncbi:PREDICTED: GRAM domain-containing protein 3 [Nanorana parkeri]|uniref:GRAM domain-containing protein 3 n=1 Tax=Nanorana parkeri TaxID=125878 RepID=UPI0008545406|nr:PREDICTED: GRAM domain-containing protein 3 [Nanorana parkeri]